jgi:GT2 family glycosyltransferase
MADLRASVIIPTTTGGDRIGALLDSLEPGKADYEVIVVDNGSRDATGESLQRHPEVEVITSETNLGYGRAVNLAARAAQGDALVLLNDDCVCDPGFVPAIAAPIGDEVAMSAGILRNRTDETIIDTAGMQLDPTLLGFDYLNGEPIEAARNAPDPLGPSAAAAAFGRDAFLESGGFDEAFFAYWEDVDLVLRLRLAGARCALARDATGTHMHSATLGSGSAQKNGLMGFGRGYLLRKWSVLHGSRAVRALMLDLTICLGQALLDRNLTGVSGRVRGYRAASETHPYPDEALAGYDAPGPIDELRRRRRRRRAIRPEQRSRAAAIDPEDAEIERQLDLPASRAHPTGSELTTTLPRPLPVGGGTAALVGGRLAGESGAPACELYLALDGRPTDEPVHAVRSRSGWWYWWSLVPIPPATGRGDLELALSGPDPAGPSTKLGSIAVEPGGRNGASPEPSIAEAVAAAKANTGPLVAICMASHRPEMELFRRQVESIRRQTHGAWICLICDDASDPETLEAMQAEIAGDPRFVLIRNRERAGFYLNYERVLAKVPAVAEYVALADQDDSWRPEKLAMLLDAIPERALAYGDMRIVDERGAEISSTYWSERRNNYTDPASLLVGNTVTGAAAMFRTDLLDQVLPFPPERGDAYHDHWIALVAMFSGGLAYVDEPLQDYVQHPGAAQGHEEANAGAAYLRLASLPRLIWHWLLALTGLRNRDEWARRYFGMHSRTQIWARTLLARCDASLDRRQRRVLQRVARAERSPTAVAWLAWRSLRPLWGANEAFGREVIVFSCAIWCRALELRSRLASARARP